MATEKVWYDGGWVDLGGGGGGPGEPYPVETVNLLDDASFPGGTPEAGWRVNNGVGAPWGPDSDEWLTSPNGGSAGETYIEHPIHPDARYVETRFWMVGSGSNWVALRLRTHTQQPMYDDGAFGALYRPNGTIGLAFAGGASDGTSGSLPATPDSALTAVRMGVLIESSTSYSLWVNDVLVARFTGCTAPTGAYLSLGAYNGTAIHVDYVRQYRGRPADWTPGASFPTYDEEVLLDVPVGYWKLDDTSGTTAIDSSGNGAHGTYVGSPSLASRTILGEPSADFDGSDDYVSIPASVVSSAPFTVEGWGIWDALNDQGSIITERGTDGYVLGSLGLHMGNQDVTNRGYLGNVLAMNGGGYGGGSYWTTMAGFPPEIGTPYHLALTHDGTTARFYINGGLVSSSTYTPASGNNGWDIGSDHNRAHFFNGTIARVALYRTALSAKRIAIHYAAALLDLSSGAGATQTEDNFDRADSSSTLGPDWDSQQSTFGISSGKAYQAYASNDGSALAAATKNGILTVELTTPASGTFLGGVAVRAQNWDRLIQVRANNYNSDKWEVYQRNYGASFTLLGQSGSFTWAPSTTYAMKVRVVGPKLDLWVDGVLLLSLANLPTSYSMLSLAGLLGFAAGSSGDVRWDNYRWVALP